MHIYIYGLTTSKTLERPKKRVYTTEKLSYTEERFYIVNNPMPEL